MYFHNEVSADSWKKMLTLAVEVKKQAPWGWLFDSDLVCIQHPQTDEYYYCSVMGAAGEHYAIALYEGNEGLYGLYQTLQGYKWESPTQMLAYQKCLMLEFDNAGLVEKTDKQQLKALGFSFRGKDAYPVVKKHDPFLFPWNATQQDIDFFIKALEVLIPFFDTLKGRTKDLPVCDEVSEGVFAMPGFGYNKAKESYNRQERVTAKASYKWPVKYILDGAMKVKSRLLPVKDASLFFLATILPTKIAENKGERPWFPINFMLFDATSGVMLSMQMYSYQDALKKGIEFFNNFFESQKNIPATICYSESKSLQFLEPAAAVYGFETAMIELPGFIDEFLMMVEMMGL